MIVNSVGRPSYDRMSCYSSDDSIGHSDQCDKLSLCSTAAYFRATMMVA